MGNFLHPDQGGAKDLDCHEEGNAIIACLKANNNSHQKCAPAIQDLYQCCAAMYKGAIAKGLDPDWAVTKACPLPEFVEANLKLV